jgi:glycerol-3-phosphate dehydrogenase (NAD(P)+)
MMDNRQHVAVLGAGNWGTTLAQLVASNGHRATLWTSDEGQCEEVNQQHTNARAAPGLVLASSIRASSDVSEAIAGSELILVAIPSPGFRDVCRLAAAGLQPEQLLIHGTKGLEAGTHRRMSEILLEETCIRQLGVLAGPNIAAEIMRGKPAGTVIASRFPRVTEAGRRALASARFRIFTGNDVLGVELCGALKNVVAIAAGIADELSVGDNAKAFLVTRGMSELMRLSFAMGADPMTLAGLAGIGDLMVTCGSPLSRNHRLGVAIARGETLARAVASLGMVAEGVHTSLSARSLAREYDVDMPMFERVARVLHEGLEPLRALEELMHLPAGRDAPRFGAAGATGAPSRHGT